MSSEPSDAVQAGGRRLNFLVAGGLLVLAGLVLWCVVRAYGESSPADVGLAYQGGEAAWSSGHPEHLGTWISTPFLGAVMAFITRVVSIHTAADLLTTLNLVLILGTVGFVLVGLRKVLSPLWWWVSAFGMVTFGPLLSTVWWKQFNLIALVGALAGFYLIRRRRTISGAGLIGLSIAIKPLAILLPFVLLARRETRRAGAWTLAWILGLNALAQGFMATRAGNFSTLNLLPLIRDFADKSKPANIWPCLAENFAPGSLLCRLAGSENWNIEHVVVWIAVSLMGLWVIDALRGRSMKSWEVFAFSCAISTMISPIAWSHYQIMLAPLFLLLLVRFTTEGASLGAVAGFLAAFILASLVWQPFGTSIGALRHLLDGAAQTQRVLVSVESVAQLAQYVLIITGVVWYLQAKTAMVQSNDQADRIAA